jgi:hypothetical protein
MMKNYDLVTLINYRFLSIFANIYLVNFASKLCQADINLDFII